MWDFIDAQLQRANAGYVALVTRRHAMLGMQGSVPSAELFLKSQGGHFARQLGVGDGVPAGGFTFVLNSLVPRPDYPTLPAAPVTPSAVIAVAPARASGLIPRPPLADIPTVHVR